MKRRITTLALALSCALLLSSCGGGSPTSSSSYYAGENSSDYVTSVASNSAGISGFKSSYASYDTVEDVYDYDYNYDYDYEYDGDSSENQSDESILDSINEEKLVYTADVDIEVMDFDESLEKLKNIVAEYDGIIQNERYSDNTRYDYYRATRVGGYRSNYLTVRIPTKNFNDFLNTTGEIGHVVSSTSSVENISQQYYNSSAYLESYKSQLENLMRMYDSATTVDEMITIEARVADVNAEILRLTTEIQSMDMDVAYSTVSITLDEVVQYTSSPSASEQQTLGQRLILACQESWENFLDFLEELMFWLIYNIWGLAIFLLIIFIVIKLIKRRKAKKNKIKAEKKKGFIDSFVKLDLAKSRASNNIPKVEDMAEIESSKQDTEDTEDKHTEDEDY